MGVYASHREQSPIQFLVDMTNLIYNLSDFICKRYGDRKSKGFSPYDFIGNKVLNDAYNAYICMVSANNIFLSEAFTREDLELRRQYFQKAEGYILSVANGFLLYINLIDNNSKIKSKTKEHMLTYVSTTCYSIKSSITKIIKKDIERAHKIELRKENRTNSNNNTNNIIPLVTEKLDNGKNKIHVTISREKITLD